MKLKPEDVIIQSWSSKPKGRFSLGTDSGVKITHIPSGTTVVCEDDRSQHRNKAKALSELEVAVTKAKQFANDVMESIDE